MASVKSPVSVWNYLLAVFPNEFVDQFDFDSYLLKMAFLALTDT